MAIVTISDLKGRKVATVDFIFVQGSADTYLYADINADHAMSLQVDIAIRNSMAKRIGWLNSSGVNSYAIYARKGSFPILGAIVGSKAIVGLRQTEIGGVSSGSIFSANQGEIGTLNLHWGDNDEAFYYWALDLYQKHTGLPKDRISQIWQDCRPVIHQDMRNIAGCSAVILKCF